MRIYVQERFFMQISANDYSVNFGLKNNSNASKKVLKDVEPELKRDITNGLNAFCDITQRRGLKGNVTLKSLDGDMLTFTVKPVKIGEKRQLSIDLTNKPVRYGAPRQEQIKHSFLDSIDYLFK